ncbi:ribonuclease E activity regulator RraA [Pedomonas sp. V897]|uniref:ribonuclease E activity regulator RraA n=1 Tax=Pedomonas sp. V897 TaxID=3446482 RepID=UPI003EDF2D84
MERLPGITADLCDALGDRALVLALDWRDYGALRRFSGPAVTVATRDDNSLVRAQLEQPGEGRVLVVDNGGGRRCAMVGGNLAALAARNGWAGVVVFGVVRDSVEMASQAVGIKALGTCPRPPLKRGEGTLNAEVNINGVTIRPGDHVVADEDGVVVVTA